MYSHAFECFISLKHDSLQEPFYICRTQVIDRRSLRSLLKKFCFLHDAELGCLVCDDIVWYFIHGTLYRGHSGYKSCV